MTPPPDQGVQGWRIKVGGSRSRSGVKVGVKVGGQGRGQGRGQCLGRSQGLGVEVVVKVGGQDRGRGQGWGSRFGEGSRFGGQGCGQGRGVKARGMIGGHKVGVNVRGQCLGEGVMVRGMRVKIWGVGVIWSVGFSGRGRL